MTVLANLFDLSGRVAVVTGGSRGLGFQVAQALGEYGATLALVARKEAELDAAVAELASRGISAHGFPADLGDRQGGAALVDAVIERFGRIDILINNAGATWGAPAENYPPEAWDKIFNLNVTGLFALTSEVARRSFLPAGKGVVVNIASIAGLRGHLPDRIGTIAYNASKGAVVNMTRALAAEWGPRNIRVNALAPGFFPSKMTSATVEQHSDAMIRGTPLGKLGGPTDLMGPALLLASDAGAHITGQILAVDGGTTVVA
ncbi:SDR family oxidoreductase [Sphingopyxis sp.]|jgi:gluconate 5-dehydrogenase|uniref:SDR family oxidoreductase n=1 Tax=Sphingopyxis sp. TaxID=1908224 RepID=UPI002DEE182B|nr:SDR family oxidoreductase [Sphingopyxis sp.]